MSSLVPHPRLIWLAALLIVPAATLAGAAPAYQVPALLMIAAIVGPAAVDAWMVWPRLRGVEAVAPPVRHSSTGRDTELTVTFAGLRFPARAGLSLPDLVRCPYPITSVSLPQAEGTWSLQVLQRGRHLFEHVYVETASPLGLWQRRVQLPLNVELRIYPDLRRERRQLAAIFLNHHSAGFHRRQQLGKGREFDHLRDYVAGDDFADIHWKSTARRGFPVTKTYRLERTQEVYVLIDHSRLSAREVRLPKQTDSLVEVEAHEGYLTGGREDVSTQLNRAIESALLLALAAERQHDRFGFATFAGQVTRFVRAGSGRAHFGVCRQQLCELEPSLVAPDFEELFISLRHKLTRRALLLLLTDLSDPLQAEHFVQSLRLVSRQHLVAVCMIRPETAAPLFSREDTSSLDEIYRDLGGHLQWHDLQEVGKVLAQQGVSFSLSEPGMLPTDLIGRYLEVKQRQML